MTQTQFTTARLMANGDEDKEREILEEVSENEEFRRKLTRAFHAIDDV